MAQQRTVTLTDDIDGTKFVKTVSFGLDGKHYEIDLGAKNAKNLRKAVSTFIEAARKVRFNGGTRAIAKKAAPQLTWTWRQSAPGPRTTESLWRPAVALPNQLKNSTRPQTSTDAPTG